MNPAPPTTSMPPAPPRAMPKAPAGPAPRAALPVLSVLKAQAIVPRLVLNGVEGWGKTSFGANAPAPAILMARGETGYQTLLNHGRAPAVPAALIDTWDGLLGLLDQLAADPGDRKSLVLDALGGFERLCHEFVCQRDFKGDWGEKGFGAFQRGADTAVTEWLGLLNRLDAIHQKGVGIYLLSHTQVFTFKNPMGADFDRYEAACHKKTWAVTHKWADEVLFCSYRTITDEKRGQKAKGIGGVERVAFTERRDAFDAKNRSGMPAEIDIPDDPVAAFALIHSLITNKEANRP